MSYGLYLYKETISVGGRTMRLEIWEKDYTGASAEIEAMGTPPFTISLDNSGGKVETPLIKTDATIIIKDTGQIDYDTLFTPDATKYKVIIKVAGVDYWYGFLTPDSFSQALSYKSDIVLTARDNLGMLSSFRYEREGTRATMRTLLNEAMTLISFGNTLEYRQIKTSGTTNILDGYIRADKYIGGTWADAVEEILHDCGLQMRFIGGAKYAVYDIGDIASLGTTLSTQTFQFINKSGNKEIVPAVKDIKLSQNYGSIDNSYDGVLNADDYSLRAVRAVTQPTNQYILQPETYNINYYDPLSSIWGGIGGVQGIVNPNEWNELPSTIMITGDLYTLTTYRQAILYSQIMPITESNVEIKMKVSNLVKYPSVVEGKAIWKDLFFMFLADPRTSIYWSGAHYQIRLRYNIFLVSATKTYVMREQWEEFTDTNPSVGTYLTFLLPSGGSDGGVPIFKDYNARDEEITFNIQTIPEDGVLQIAFYPYEIVGQFVQEYPSVVPQDIKNNIPLTYPILIKDITIKYPAAEIGGLDSQAIISADHNVSLDVNLNLGQVPSGVGDSATMQGGIYSNGANYYKALGNFFRTAGTEYHLSELIGREIVNIYKVQREKLSGQIINSTNYAALPSFGKTFTANGKLYALNFGSLDFANEVMQVELVEVDAYETEDFTFVEAAIDTGGGTSLGSGDTTFLQWSAAGNATRIYSLDTATEAEQGGAYVVVDKIGLASAKKVALLDLLVDAYTKTESDAKYLGITAKAADSELLDNHDSTYFATATGGTGYIQNQVASAQTADYWISGKAKMGTLVLPTSATLASGEVGLYTTESGFSGELPSGAGSMTNITLSLPTGLEVSLDNTNFAQSKQITGEGGTFYTRVTSDYVLPTALQLSNKVETSLIGAANGITPLDSGGKVALQYLPSTLLKYMGVWNASTNSPTLTSPDTNRKGQVWNVSVAGTQFGLDFKLGDWLIYNDSGVAEKSDNSDDVTSVNGYTGAVTLKTSDIAEQTNLYYTDARVKSYADTLYTPIAHGQITSGNPHGTTAADVGALALSGGTLTGNLILGRSGVNDLDFLLLVPSFQLRLFGNYWNSGIGNIQIETGQIYGVTTASNIATSAITRVVLKAAEIGGNLVEVVSFYGDKSTIFQGSIAGQKLTSTTLILPQTTPSLATGEMAIYGLESGFSGETPSGAGSVESVELVSNLTGISVTGSPITTSGTFTLNFVTGYSIPTNIKQGEWDSAYTLRHNAVTLGTANGLSLSTQELSLGLASTSTNGALSSTDWNTFNSKAAGDHNHNDTYALLEGSTSQAFNTASLLVNNDLTINGNNLQLDGSTNKTIRLQSATDWYYHIKTIYDDFSITDAQDYEYLRFYYNGGTKYTKIGDVSITGGAISGATSGSFSGEVSAASFTSGGNAVIHSGNIGTQSVANADTLDNQHASYFATAAQLNASNLASGYLPYWNGSSLANSIISQDGNTLLLAGASNKTIRIESVTSWWYYLKTINDDFSISDAQNYDFIKLVYNGGAKYTKIGNVLITGGALTDITTVTMTENINTNLRIPKVAPTSPTSGQYYFYIVE